MSQPLMSLLIPTLTIGVLAVSAAHAAPVAPTVEEQLAQQGQADQIVNPEERDKTLPAPTKPLLVVAPNCPGPECDLNHVPQVPEAQGLRVIYLNWNGVTISNNGTGDDATNNTSRILRTSSINIPALQKEHLREASTEGMNLDQIKDYVVGNIKYHMRDYNVDVVTQRPSGGWYHMIVFSPLADCGQVAGADCAGIAPLDCGDGHPSNVVWVFANNLRVSDLATTTSHEAAHAMGLGHTTDTKDIMYPSILSSIPDSFGAGPYSDDSSCSGNNFQDSDALMLQTIGAGPSDNAKPAVDIVRPLPGLTIGGGSIIEARIMDDSAIDNVKFYLNGTLFRDLGRANRPWQVLLSTATSEGPLDIRIVATDIHGNQGESTANVTFAKGGSTPCVTDDQCNVTGFLCDDGVCVAPDQVTDNLGDSCASDADCDSGVCGSLGDESRCTQTCQADAECPGGFECMGGAACWPADGGGGGCSTSGKSPVGTLMLAGMALVFLRRRSR